MREKHYQNREIDAKFEAVHERFNLQDTALAKILAQTTATNGKVRKIIMALMVMVGVAIGFGGKDFVPLLIKLLA